MKMPGFLISEIKIDFNVGETLKFSESANLDIRFSKSIDKRKKIRGSLKKLKSR